MMGSAPRRLMTGVFAGMAAVLTASSAFGYATPRVKPPAPGPAYLSQSDHDLLQDAVSALKSKQFVEAQAKTAAITAPVARSLGDWLYFMAQDPLVNLAKADAFLDIHNDWPATSRIQSHVESRIPNNAPADTVLAFFDTRDPLTGDGKVQLARAFFNKGDTEAGESYLRDAWINNNFTIAEERAILKSYGARLTKEDHAARVDRLLWARQVTNARRIFARLDSHERKKAQARAALLMGASSAPSLYRKLSKDDQLDSGVLLAAVRYYRRSGNEKHSISLAAQSPKDPETLRNSRRWWYERQLLMRWALKNGRFADAYTAASNHGLEPGGDYAEAEFNAGWIALRFLNEPERAETHFLALASVVGTPISRSRAFYWLGRTAAASHETELANAYYQNASQYYYSYYGQLAAEELGGEALQQKFSYPTTATPVDKARFGSRSTVAALRMLADLDLDYEFMVFSYHVDDQLDRPGEYLELASLTNGEGAPHLTVRAGKVAIQRDAFTPEVAYPVVFVPEEAKRFVPPEIILGLSRQESEFNPRAYSRAGARGVMQLLPTTAQITARKEGLRYSRSALLDDPVYNMTIGSAHLSHLLDRFDGSLILTFAGYNAGAARSTQWIATYGDPRIDGVDPIDWVELIPFSETRNYVQRVLENIQVYRGRLNDAPIPGRLSADLERGGARNRSAKFGALPSPPIFAAATSLGDQRLSPLPAATAIRAAEYKLTLAAMNAEPEATLEAEALLTADEVASVTIAPAEDATQREAASKTSNIVTAEQSVPTPSLAEATVLAQPDEQVAAPIATAESSPVLSEPLGEQAAKQEDQPSPKVEMTQQTVTEASPVTIATTAPAAPIASEALATTNTPTSLAIDAIIAKMYETSGDPVEPEQTPVLEVETEAAETAAFAAEALRSAELESNEFGASNSEEALDECPAYRDFLERNFEEGAAAANFDAAMLAEMQRRGACH